MRETSERTTVQWKTSGIARPLKDQFLLENEGFSSLPCLFQFSVNRGFLGFHKRPQRPQFQARLAQDTVCSVRVHEGPWQKVLPKLAANTYDLIFYDPLNISPRQGNLKHRKKSDGSPKHLNLGVLRCSRSLGFPFFPTDDGSDFRQLKNMAEILCPAADILERSSSTKVGASRFVSLRHSSHELRGKFMVESPISDAQKAVSSHSNFHMRNPHFLCNLVQLFHSLTICKVWHDLR